MLPSEDIADFPLPSCLNGSPPRIVSLLTSSCATIRNRLVVTGLLFYKTFER